MNSTLRSPPSPVLPDHSIVVYTFQEDREYDAPKEKPLDGFWRGDWERRKDQGKDAFYAATKDEFQKHIDLEGPQGAASPQGAYNPNPNP